MKPAAIDLATFKGYSDAVSAQTDEFLKNLSDAEMERKMQGPFGETTVAWIVLNLLGTHRIGHIGEIATLKGIMGLKGLPF